MKKYSQEWWASLPPERTGKETEKLVEALFTDWNANVKFAWGRLPDSKSARAYLKAQPADYMYRCGPCAGFVEVKALKHEYRLPAERVSQLQTLHKWSLAGSADVVLVHHYMIGNWRAVRAEELVTGAPSWDLRQYPTYDSAEAALLSTGYFGAVNTMSVTP